MWRPLHPCIEGTKTINTFAICIAVKKMSAQKVLFFPFLSKLKSPDWSRVCWRIGNWQFMLSNTYSTCFRGGSMAWDRLRQKAPTTRWLLLLLQSWTRMSRQRDSQDKDLCLLRARERRASTNLYFDIDNAIIIPCCSFVRGKGFELGISDVPFEAIWI